MSTLPPVPEIAGAAGETSADRAMSLALSGEKEAALRVATAILRDDPASAPSLCIVGRVLGELGRVAAAREALEVATARAIDLGNLPLAVAAARELARFEGDAGPALDQVAEAFCKGSPSASGAALPPPIPRGAVAPLPDTATGDALLDAAESAVVAADAKAAARARPGVARLPLFSSLGRDGLRSLLDPCEAQWLPAGTVVIEQGTDGDDAYFVALGELEVRRQRGDEAMVLARLGYGALFGEMALLARAPRYAGVTAARPSIVLRVTRGALDVLADRHPDVGVELARHCRGRMVDNLLWTSRILQVVPASDRAALIERFETRIFEAGAQLITQDGPSPGLFLIASGEVAVMRRDAGGDRLLIARLGPGDVVGEVAMVLRRRANADVVAQHPLVTLFLPAGEFLGLVHDHPAMLAELYLLAVSRDEETSSVIQQETSMAEDFILV